jgi:hypothetical protein
MWIAGVILAAVFLGGLILLGRFGMQMERKQDELRSEFARISLEEIPVLAEKAIGLFRDTWGYEIDLDDYDTTAKILSEACGSRIVQQVFSRMDRPYEYIPLLTILVGEFIRRHARAQWSKEPDDPPCLEIETADGVVRKKPFERLWNLPTSAGEAPNIHAFVLEATGRGGLPLPEARRSVRFWRVWLEVLPILSFTVFMFLAVAMFAWIECEPSDPPVYGEFFVIPMALVFITFVLLLGAIGSVVSCIVVAHLLKRHFTEAEWELVFGQILWKRTFLARVLLRVNGQYSGNHKWLSLLKRGKDEFPEPIELPWAKERIDTTPHDTKAKRPVLEKPLRHSTIPKRRTVIILFSALTVFCILFWVVNTFGGDTEDVNRYEVSLAGAILMTLLVIVLLFFARGPLGRWTIDEKGVSYQPIFRDARRIDWPDVEQVVWSRANIIVRNRIYTVPLPSGNMLGEDLRGPFREFVRGILTERFDLSNSPVRVDRSFRTGRSWARVLAVSTVGCSVVIWIWRQIINDPMNTYYQMAFVAVPLILLLSMFVFPWRHYRKKQPHPYRWRMPRE